MKFGRWYKRGPKARGQPRGKGQMLVVVKHIIDNLFTM